MLTTPNWIYLQLALKQSRKYYPGVLGGLSLSANFSSKLKKYTLKIASNKAKNCYVWKFPEAKPRMLTTPNWIYLQLALKKSRKYSLGVLEKLSFSGNFSWKLKKYTLKIASNKPKNCYVWKFPEPKPRMLRTPNWIYLLLALKQSRKYSLGVLGGLSLSANFSSKLKKYTLKIASNKAKNCYVWKFPEAKPRMLTTPNWIYLQLALKQSRKYYPWRFWKDLVFPEIFHGNWKNIPLKLPQISLKIAMFQNFPEPKPRMLRTPNWIYLQLALKQSRKYYLGVLGGLSLSANFSSKLKKYTHKIASNKGKNCYVWKFPEAKPRMLTTPNWIYLLLALKQSRKYSPGV